MCDLNFAVRSRHAASMSLCLARQTSDPQSKVGYIEVALDPLLNKTGASSNDALCMQSDSADPPAMQQSI